jgi:hypothetical protein
MWRRAVRKADVTAMLGNVTVCVCVGEMVRGRDESSDPALKDCECGVWHGACDAEKWLENNTVVFSITWGYKSTAWTLANSSEDVTT